MLFCGLDASLAEIPKSEVRMHDSYSKNMVLLLHGPKIDPFDYNESFQRYESRYSTKKSQSLRVRWRRQLVHFWIGNVTLTTLELYPLVRRRSSNPVSPLGLDGRMIYKGWLASWPAKTRRGTWWGAACNVSIVERERRRYQPLLWKSVRSDQH